MTAEYQEDLINYCADHPEETGLINRLLYDQANRNLDIMCYKLAFLGSGAFRQSPPKKAQLDLDAGGCGKTTMAEFTKAALEPLYVHLLLPECFWLLSEHIWYKPEHICLNT